MKVGLINIEPTVYNTALMQISEAHKSWGSEVSWALPLEYDDYDLLFCSSLFTFTNKETVPSRAICGGTGFDIKKKLPDGIERSQLDYSIYPDCDTSYIWFSRGCINDCPFCVVRQKEGKLHAVQRKCLNPNGRYISVMDNNFFANPEWESNLWFIADYPVDFNGVDVRILTPAMCKALDKLKRWKNKRLKIAWDDPKHDLTPYMNMMFQYVKPWKVMVYVLIGYWSTPEEDLHRVMTIKNLGADPYVMPYNKFDDYQSQFARWCNSKPIFKTVKWKDDKWQKKRK